MGMMTEYYHYIFTTLVSIWTLVLCLWIPQEDHLLVFPVGTLSICAHFLIRSGAKKNALMTQRDKMKHPSTGRSAPLAKNTPWLITW